MTRDTSAPTEPRWLSSEEMTLWRTYLEASERLHAVLEADLKAVGGVTFDDYEVLVHLSEADGRRLRMSDLSDRLLHSRSRLSQRIDRLARRGLVERQKCEEDRRGTWAVLTDVGWDTMGQLAPRHVEAVRQHLFDRIDPQQIPTLTDALHRVAAGLRVECDGVEPSAGPQA